MAEIVEFRQIEALLRNQRELKDEFWQKGATLCTLIFEILRNEETRFEPEKRVKKKIP